MGSLLEIDVINVKIISSIGEETVSILRGSQHYSAVFLWILKGETGIELVKFDYIVRLHAEIALKNDLMVNLLKRKDCKLLKGHTVLLKSSRLN